MNGVLTHARHTIRYYCYSMINAAYAEELLCNHRFGRRFNVQAVMEVWGCLDFLCSR